MAAQPYASTILSVALALTAAASPRQSPKKSPQEVSPVRVTTRLVQVSVIAQDRKGELVADLKRDEFIVSDEGQLQEVAAFSVESKDAVTPLDPLPPDVFSNHLDRRGERPASVTVILLDGLNTRVQDQAYARQQIIKFLGQIRAEDRIALYALGMRLSVLHDFTSDAKPLLRALERYKGRANIEVDAAEPDEPDTGDEQLDEFLRNANERVAAYVTINRVERTLQGLTTIANHLAAFPGRKNLVWVSSAFPLAVGYDRVQTLDATPTQRTFTEEVTRTARAMNSAGVAIYPVDARGLVAPFGDVNRSRQVGGPRQMIVGAPDRTRTELFSDTRDSMRELASRTGGRAFYNTNDIMGAVRRAIDDSRVTYVVGYYPTHGQWDGRFRKIRVQVKRPGVTVRYRSGYFAFPDVTLDARQGQALMRAAAWSPLDATGVGVTVRATRFKAAGTEVVKLQIAVDPRSLALEVRDNRRFGALETLVLQRTEDDKVFGGRISQRTIKATGAEYEQLMRTGLALEFLIELMPRASRLLLVVRDVTSSAIGSVSIPVDRLPQH